MDVELRENNHLYHLSFWWFLLASISVGVLTEGIAFFEGWGVWFEDWGYFLMCGIAFLLCLSYCVFAHVHFHIKPAWIFLVLFLALLVGNTIAIATFPKSSTLPLISSDPPEQVTYVLEDIDRVRYVVSFGITCFYFYILWAIAPKCLRNSNVVLFVITGLLLLCFALIIYSWIAEWGLYMRYFDSNTDVFYETNISSFSGNRNTFGAIILFGIVSLGILQSRRHCWIHYVLIALFSLQEIFIFSKTCLIILAFYLPAFTLYRFVATVRYNPVRSCVCLSVFIHVCIAIAIAWAISVNAMENSFFEKIGEMLKETIFSEKHETIDARGAIWKFLIEQLNNPLRIAFGLGESNMQWLLGPCDGHGEFGFTHNGYLLQLAAGGVLRSVIYVALFGYVIFLYIRGFVRHRRGTFAFLLGFLAAHMHALTETTSFLETDGKGILISFIFILPFLIEQRKVGVAEARAAQKETPRLAKPYTYALLGVSLLPLFASVLLYVARASSWNLMPFFIAFGIALSLTPLPVVISCCAKKRSFLRGYLLTCGLFIAISVGSLLLAYFLPLTQIVSNIALLSSLCLVCYVLVAASCHRWLDLSVFHAGQERIENYFSTRSPRWFVKGQRREDRYFSKS